MSQGILTQRNPLEQLQKSHLGKAVLKMVELQKTLQSKEIYVKLFNALDLLKTQLIESKEQEVQYYFKTQDLNFIEDQGTQNTQSEIINNLINIYTDQVSILTATLSSLQQDANQLQDDNSFAQQQLELSINGWEQEKNYLQELDQTHSQEVSNYEGVLKLLVECIHKLNGIEKEDSAFSSFIQTNQQYFSEFSNELEVKIKQVNKQILLKPLTNFFVQLSSEETTIGNIYILYIQDLDAVSRASEALQGLVKLFQAGLDRTKNQYKLVLEEHTNLQNNFNAQILSIRDEVIPRTQQDIDTNLCNPKPQPQSYYIQSLQENQENKRLQLTDSTNNLVQAQNNLQQENESWAQRLEQHEILIPQLDQEYHVVVQAIRVISVFVAEQPQQ